MPITMTTPQYNVSVSTLKIRDIIAIQTASTTGDMKTLIDIYSKCIELPEGVDFLDLPAKHLQVIAQAIIKEMSADMGN